MKPAAKDGRRNGGRASAGTVCVLEAYSIAGMILYPHLIPLAERMPAEAFSWAARGFIAALTTGKDIKHVEPNAIPLLDFIVQLLDEPDSDGSPLLRDDRMARRCLDLLAEPFRMFSVADALRHAAEAIEHGRDPDREIRDALALASDLGVWGAHAA